MIDVFIGIGAIIILDAIILLFVHASSKWDKGNDDYWDEE